jgi:hypothetical protein
MATRSISAPSGKSVGSSSVSLPLCTRARSGCMPLRISRLRRSCPCGGPQRKEDQGLGDVCAPTRPALARPQRPRRLLRSQCAPCRLRAVVLRPGLCSCSPPCASHAGLVTARPRRATEWYLVATASPRHRPTRFARACKLSSSTSNSRCLLEGRLPIPVVAHLPTYATRSSNPECACFWGRRPVSCTVANRSHTAS